MEKEWIGFDQHALASRSKVVTESPSSPPRHDRPHPTPLCRVGRVPQALEVEPVRLVQHGLGGLVEVVGGEGARSVLGVVGVEEASGLAERLHHRVVLVLQELGAQHERRGALARVVPEVPESDRLVSV